MTCKCNAEATFGRAGPAHAHSTYGLSVKSTAIRLSASGIERRQAHGAAVPRGLEALTSFGQWPNAPTSPSPDATAPGRLVMSASYEVFDSGERVATCDFQMVSVPGVAGAVERISIDGVTRTVVLSGVPVDDNVMSPGQAFTALRHMQDRSKSIAAAFGQDIKPSAHGMQAQGVVAFLAPMNEGAPSMVQSARSVRRVAFLLRDGWLLISTLDGDGRWHSDAAEIIDALDDLSLGDYVPFLGKLIALVSVAMSWWQAVTVGATCAAGAVTGIGAILLCAGLIIALSLATVLDIIKIVKELTDQTVAMLSVEEARRALKNGDTSLAESALNRARFELMNYMGTAFPYRKLGRFIGSLIPPTQVTADAPSEFHQQVAVAPIRSYGDSMQRWHDGGSDGRLAPSVRPSSEPLRARMENLTPLRVPSTGDGLRQS